MSPLCQCYEPALRLTDAAVCLCVCSSSSRPALPYSSHISSELVWVGRTHPHVTVPAGGAARLPLAAAVTRPGLYDLGSVGVACRRAGADAAELTEQSARTESAVVVRRATDATRLN